VGPRRLVLVRVKTTRDLKLPLYEDLQDNTIKEQMPQL
jgi:hypothetical protein